MKNPLGWIVVVAFLAGAAGCNEAKEQGKTGRQEVLLQTDTVWGREVKQLRSQVVDETVLFRKKEYRIHIKREADNSLTMVKTEEGETFKDNRILLQIKTEAERIVFSKVFRKESFASMVEARFMPYVMLDGLAFDKTSEKGFHFVAGMSYPQSDFYVPISIVISPDGKLTMFKTDFMEETSTEE